jgi:hypothetical protein
VNERITDLLDRASDDEGAPMGFSGATIARRARAERRRRRTFGGVAVGLAAASVAGILVATQLLASPHATSEPAVESSTTATPSAPPSSSRPSLTPQEQSIMDRCARVLVAPSGATVSDPSPGTDPGQVRAPVPSDRDAGFLRSWTLDAHVQDAQGVTATFVDPEHTRWASCQLAAGGADSGNEVDMMGPLPHGPVPQSWYGPNGFRHQATSPSWSQVCAPGDGKVCPRELYAGAFAVYDGVKAVRVDAPDGTTLTPVFGDYTYVFRHVEQRVDAHRAANDMQQFPSMPVTLLDGHGHTIIRYDYFPSYLLPSSCPATGGC